MFIIQMKGFLILFFFFVVSLAAANNISTHNRDEKLFGVVSPFTVARFANTECDRDFHTGTCYTPYECHTGVTGVFDLFDTSTASQCQTGFGSCCITALGCDGNSQSGGTSSNNNTYLRSPGYNSKFNYGLDCTQSIKIDSSICQLR
ncbi:unnamed protein product, partial [Meganyctiphanes norvegica]